MVSLPKPLLEPTIEVFVRSYSCMLCAWYQLSKEHTADAMDLPGYCPLKIKCVTSKSRRNFTLLNYTIFHNFFIVVAAIMSAKTSTTHWYTIVPTTANMKCSHSKLTGILRQKQELLFTSTAISEFAWQMLPVPPVNVQIMLPVA